MLKTLNKVIKNLKKNNIDDVKYALKVNFRNSELELTDEDALYEIINLEIGDNWAEYWAGYFSALDEIKYDFKKEFYKEKRKTLKKIEIK